MSEEKQPLRSSMVQIAVSGTPVDVNPDRSLLKVFPKWLKVAKLWFQRERASETSAFFVFRLLAILCLLQARINEKLKLSRLLLSS